MPWLCYLPFFIPDILINLTSFSNLSRIVVSESFLYYRPTTNRYSILDFSFFLSSLMLLFPIYAIHNQDCFLLAAIHFQILST